MKSAILGSTGYTGQVLLRLLLSHPDIEQIYPVSSTAEGQSVLDRDPGVSPAYAGKLSDSGGCYVNIGHAREAQPDVVFAALPHLQSAVLAAPFLESSVLIDLSADFRIRSPEIFRQAYGQEPPRKDLLDRAVYGLSEWYREQIAGADLIANPGCYPTATLLPLLPLFEKNMVSGPVVVNALSGISGAGRKARENLLYASRTENAAAYAPGHSHRHWQEISSQAEALGDFRGGLYFTPHLIPVHHGMEVTTSFPLADDAEPDAVGQALHDRYADSPFVRIRNDIPETSQVRGTNRCDIAWHREGRQIFLISVIDNLYKGAAGQAVQNMNIRFGLDETAGLNLHGEI
jgi:N-acetyl-gamma-glutamyl-phosphate reductase